MYLFTCILAAKQVAPPGLKGRLNGALMNTQISSQKTHFKSFLEAVRREIPLMDIYHAPIDVVRSGHVSFLFVIFY